MHTNWSHLLNSRTVSSLLNLLLLSTQLIDDRFRLPVRCSYVRMATPCLDGNPVFGWQPRIWMATPYLDGNPVLEATHSLISLNINCWFIASSMLALTAQEAIGWEASWHVPTEASRQKEAEWGVERELEVPSWATRSVRQETADISAV